MTGKCIQHRSSGAIGRDIPALRRILPRYREEARAAAEIADGARNIDGGGALRLRNRLLDIRNDKGKFFVTVLHLGIQLIRRHRLGDRSSAFGHFGLYRCRAINCRAFTNHRCSLTGGSCFDRKHWRNIGGWLALGLTARTRRLGCRNGNSRAGGGKLVRGPGRLLNSRCEFLQPLQG